MCRPNLRIITSEKKPPSLREGHLAMTSLSKERTLSLPFWSKPTYSEFAVRPQGLQGKE
jgi:hypothetical protein